MFFFFSLFPCPHSHHSFLRFQQAHLFECCLIQSGIYVRFIVTVRPTTSQTLTHTFLQHSLEIRQFLQPYSPALVTTFVVAPLLQDMGPTTYQYDDTYSSDAPVSRAQRSLPFTSRVRS